MSIAAGVTLGGIFTGMFFLCLREADKYETWADVPYLVSFGAMVPPLFVALILTLADQEEPEHVHRAAPVHQEGPDPLGLFD